MEARVLRPTIGDGQADADVVRRTLGIFGDDVKVPIVIEDSGVSELELRLGTIAPAILGDKSSVWKRALRILVERLRIRRRRSRVEVIVAFFDVLTVIALRTGETEEPFFQDGIALVPERHGKRKTAFSITDAEK